jgi:circadian clock protein KaiC
MIKSEIAEFRSIPCALRFSMALLLRVSNEFTLPPVLSLGSQAAKQKKKLQVSSTSTTDQFMGSHSITDSHISHHYRHHLMLHYDEEIRGEMLAE